MNISICDDNKVYIEMLDKIIGTYMKENNIQYNLDTFSSGDELIKAFNKNHGYYNLIFLDILLGEKNGVDIARILKKNNENVEIIFVTTTKEFVFNGYDIGVMNYILKPFNKEKINNELTRYINKENINTNDKFYIKRKEAIEIISIKDILYFDIYNRIVTVHTKKRNIQFYEKLESIEKKVKSFNFIKCHRSYLVNLKYVERIENNDLYLINSEKIPISRLRLSKVKNEVVGYIRYL